MQFVQYKSESFSFLLDVMTNLVNRYESFAIAAQEKTYKTPVTIENWKSRVNHKRAVKAAKRVK